MAPPASRGKELAPRAAELRHTPDQKLNSVLPRDREGDRQHDDDDDQFFHGLECGALEDCRGGLPPLDIDSGRHYINAKHYYKRTRMYVTGSVVTAFAP